MGDEANVDGMGTDRDGFWGSPSWSGSWVLGVIVVVVLVGLLAMFGWMRGGSEPAPTPEPFLTGIGLAEGLELAAEAERPLVVVATASWCVPCQAYKREALSAEAVSSLLESGAVAMLLDIDRHRDDAVRLNAGVIPTTLVLEGGEVRGLVRGALPEPRLLEFLEEHGVRDGGGG